MHVKEIRPEDFYVQSDELQAAGAKTRAKSSLAGRDPLDRFLSVPNHAMFLFTSEDVLLDAYIRDHWAALDGLSGEICDIHVSLTQLQGLEDAYTQLNDVRSIPGLSSISLSILPVLHIWSAKADLTFSLKEVESNFDKLKDALRNIFGSMHSLGGPITEAWATRMRTWNASLSKQNFNGSAQAVLGSTAGRDIIQIVNFYHSTPDMGDLEMETSPTKSDQSVQSTEVRGALRQKSDAVNAKQSVASSSASSVDQVVSSRSFDLAVLSSDLAKLRHAMRMEASTGEHDIALGNVAAAEAAATKGDESAALNHLKAAGKWALDVAEKIGIGVAVAALKTAIGL